MNIDNAWDLNATGQGILIGVVDEGGIPKNHPEFNYVRYINNYMCLAQLPTLTHLFFKSQQQQQ